MSDAVLGDGRSPKDEVVSQLRWLTTADIAAIFGRC